ncbi:hypothetical protein BT96DRAFT_927846, partial [Gymnopus androsaceus JB14]
PPSLINTSKSSYPSPTRSSTTNPPPVPSKYPLQVALSFCLDPGFLPEVEYPKEAVCDVFVIGNESRGFHIRFKDVARGGIRIDIPKGGAIGTILPSLGATSRVFFLRNMSMYAALYARDRGAETLGGVPHDTYGMTSLSIRQTKVQTGGPDGDLGSNEILLSSDKTVAIIDGSGVLADPAGLDHEELVRLAKKRLTVAHFNRTRLSKDGYLVKIEEQDPAKSFSTGLISVMELI